MEALHLVYQHWFITVLVLALGVAPVVDALGRAIGTARGRKVIVSPVRP